jgi:hypothetical protein
MQEMQVALKPVLHRLHERRRPTTFLFYDRTCVFLVILFGLLDKMVIVLELLLPLVQDKPYTWRTRMDGTSSEVCL